MEPYRKKSLLDALATTAYLLNFIVTAIVAIETILRFISFMRSWKPKSKRPIGFRKEG
jgi:hypothetical protein